MSLLLSLTRQLGATLSNPASSTSPIRYKICRLSKTRCQSTNFRTTRYYAAVAASAKPASTEQNMTPTFPGANNVMIILEDVRRLLASDFGGNIKWVQRIDSAKVDLQQPRKGRIAVLGDGPSGAQELVSALLQDPLADSAQSRQALLDRHLDSNTDVLTLRSGNVPHRSVEALDVTSAWLQQAGYEIKEINSSADDSIIESALFGSDIIVIVVDPYRLLSSVAQAILEDHIDRERVLIVVNGQLPPSTTESQIRRQIETQILAFNGATASTVDICFVNARQAISAFSHLPRSWTIDVAERAHANSIEAFQQDYLQSQIGGLQSRLSDLSAQSLYPQVDSATSLAQLALAHMSKVIKAETRLNLAIRRSLEQISNESEQVAVKAKHLSVISRGIEGGMVEGGIKHSLQETKIRIEELFRDRWSWLNLIMKARADEVGSELKILLQVQFGSDLDRQLVFESGQLAQIQETLSRKTDDHLRELSVHHRPDGQPGPFTSPVLLNHLSTLSLSVPPFDATSLLGPISLRRRQLLRETIPRLQLSVQRSLLSTLALAGSGLFASWLICVPPLSLASTATAVGMGILSVISAIALGQRSWSRAQRKFWDDWQRITSMLKGDLQALLDETIQTRLLSKSRAASEGLEKIQLRREHRLGELEKAVRGLRERI